MTTAEVGLKVGAGARHVLGDLSVQRQRNLLWPVSGTGFRDLDWDSLTNRNCGMHVAWNQSRYDRAGQVARLGSDGFFHLIFGDHVVCADRFDRRAGYRHRSRGIREFVLPDGYQPRSNCYGERIWSVRDCALSGDVDILSVVRNRQCPGGYWPPALRIEGKKSARLVPIRRALINNFGSSCVLCKGSWASCVDHDHMSGQVRGYLCVDCNTQVDMCAHPTGCIYSTYLNDPPAASLALTYPWHDELADRLLNRERRRRVEEMLRRLRL